MNFKSDYDRVYGINVYPKNPFFADFGSKSWVSFFTTGGTLVKETKDDGGDVKHESLKLFDNTVSAMSLSKDGRFLAVGQIGTDNYKEKIAFVAVLDPCAFKVIVSLSQYRDEILRLEFSKDSQYMAVLTKDEKLAIHSTKDFTNVRYFDKIKIRDFCWVQMSNGTQLLTSIQYVKVDRFEVVEDAFGRLQVSHNVVMIADGPKRNYEVIKVSDSGQFIYAATGGGELNVFDLTKAKYLNSYAVSNAAITYIEDFGDHILVADHQNTLKKVYLIGKIFDAEKVQLTETIKYITRNPYDPNEAYMVTKEGSLLRYDGSKFQIQFVSKSPVNRIRAVDINTNKKLIALACDNGDVEFWDLEYRTYISRYHFDKTPVCTRVYLSDQLDICIAGYSDGSIRAFSVWGLNLNSDIICEYIIPKAHKSAIGYIQLEGNQLITSANDSMIRIWNFKTKTLINELQYHCKEISYIAFDKTNKDIIFTCAKDRQLIAYSLSRNQKMGCSIIPNGYVTTISQIDPNTIVTAGYNCDIGVWDKRGMNLIKKYAVNKTVNQILYLHKDQLIWIDSEGFLSVFDMEAGQVVWEKRISYTGVCYFFNHEGQSLLVFNNSGEFVEVDLI